MTYRLTKKAAQTRLDSMRRGMDRIRMEGPAPDYPVAINCMNRAMAGNGNGDILKLRLR